MKETERIVKLFDDLYEGDPWIDVNCPEVNLPAMNWCMVSCSTMLTILDK